MNSTDTAHVVDVQRALQIAAEAVPGWVVRQDHSATHMEPRSGWASQVRIVWIGETPVAEARRALVAAFSGEPGLDFIKTSLKKPHDVDALGGVPQACRYLMAMYFRGEPGYVEFVEQAEARFAPEKATRRAWVTDGHSQGYEQLPA